MIFGISEDVGLTVGPVLILVGLILIAIGHRLNRNKRRKEFLDYYKQSRVKFGQNNKQH